MSIEEAMKFMDDRRAGLLSGPASICTPYGEPNYAPFTYSRYAYHRLTGYMGDQRWLDVFKQRPQDLLTVNPFTPSRFRPGGLAIWDAAVGIPACRERNIHAATHTKDTPVIKGGNTYWDQTLTPAINKVGPLGVNKQILRPEDKYIVDLTRLGELGYRMRMAAHAMAHMRGDHKDESKPRKNDKTKLGGFIAGITGEMVFAYMYDLPFNTALRQDGLNGEPDFKQYGIEVKASTQFELPVLKVPWMSGEAPRFDSTIAMVNLAVFIEPHPYGWTSRTMQHSTRDYWCCTPTIVAMVGWEMVDFITHQPLISSCPGDLDWPVGYGVHPLDMLGADTLRHYLALARQARGEPVYTQELRDVKEWLYSKDFDRLINRYPPLPCCIDCMSWNERAEGAPLRPRQPRPFKAGENRQLELMWERYDADRKAIKKTMVEPAVKAYEAMFYGSRQEANRRRREQAANYRVTRERVDEARVLARAIKKDKEGRNLTDQESRLLSAHYLQLRAARTAQKQQIEL